MNHVFLFFTILFFLGEKVFIYDFCHWNHIYFNLHRFYFSLIMDIDPSVKAYNFEKTECEADYSFCSQEEIEEVSIKIESQKSELLEQCKSELQDCLQDVQSEKLIEEEQEAMLD